MLGYQSNGTPSEGGCPTKWLGSEHFFGEGVCFFGDVLGIRSSGEGIAEDLYMAAEEPEAWGRRIASTMRKRKYSSLQKE